MAVTFADVSRAAATLAGHILNTPLLHSRTLSRLTGAEIFLKFENHQFTASFKERGALNRLLALTDAERRNGVVAASAGNHAQAVAYHSQRLGIPATIVMPRFTPGVKVEHTREYGAEVILHGEMFDDAKRHARGLVEARGLTWVDPYDDALVIAGQGTVALEMLATAPTLDMLVVPIGGGGLISGMAVAAATLAPGVDMVGVQTTRFPSMHAALEGRPVEWGPGTIADGIAVKQPGTLTLPIVRAHVRDIVLVDEHEIERAILLLHEVEKTVVEGAGAAGLAAVLAQPDRFKGRRLGVVLSGGNIDPLVMAGIIERGLVRTGRLTRLTVELKDRPGGLAQLTACLAEMEANVQEIVHQRTFSRLPVQVVAVDVVLETRGPEHAEAIVARLEALGMHARRRD
ncbi:MAG: threonine ammonia-lyase [Vicinamibacterales bacterium]